jgi:hypothetical protein
MTLLTHLGHHTSGLALPHPLFRTGPRVGAGRREADEQPVIDGRVYAVQRWARSASG